MSTIYEDVAALQEAVGTLQEDMANVITAVGVTVLEANADLHALGVGKYLIPNATVSATILNKPTTSTHTAVVEVVAGGDSGQLTMYYRPCSKASDSYYHTAYYQSAWGDWNEINLTDSGWIDLTLNSGITAYSEEQKPRYRRVGKEVFLSGVFKGVTASNTAIATLPSGYRPSKKILVASAAVGQVISRITVDTDGTITYNRSTIEPIVAENYHSIACTFNVD